MTCRATGSMHLSSPSVHRSCQPQQVFGPTQRSPHLSHCRSRNNVITAAAKTKVKVLQKYGAKSVQGTSRKRNEDRFDLQVDDDSETGQPFAYAGVFDGHGGSATSQWLEENFSDYIAEHWTDGQSPEQDINKAFLQADKVLLAPKKGFLGGLGERGIGGSKCGATGAVAVLHSDKNGKVQLLAANAGDARVILARKGKAVQLTEDHVPDMDKERMRIEAKNPNPKLPLVRYVGGTWRVGGILALSRAFGDAYLKGSGQFEGYAAGGDGYSSGFGVIADPYVTLTQLSSEDTWIVIASDGLFENDVRGGGGGLENQEVVDYLLKAPKDADVNQLSQQLIDAAQEQGTTDDVTVICIKLSL